MPNTWHAWQAPPFRQGLLAHSEHPFATWSQLSPLYCESHVHDEATQLASANTGFPCTQELPAVAQQLVRSDVTAYPSALLHEH